MAKTPAAKVKPAGTKVKYIPKGASPATVKRAVDSVVKSKPSAKPTATKSAPKTTRVVNVPAKRAVVVRSKGVIVEGEE